MKNQMEFTFRNTFKKIKLRKYLAIYTVNTFLSMVCFFFSAKSRDIVVSSRSSEVFNRLILCHDLRFVEQV